QAPPRRGGCRHRRALAVDGVGGDPRSVRPHHRHVARSCHWWPRPRRGQLRTTGTAARRCRRGWTTDRVTMRRHDASATRRGILLVALYVVSITLALVASAALI